MEHWLRFLGVLAMSLAIQRFMARLLRRMDGG
jgi:hypothetical protein